MVTLVPSRVKAVASKAGFKVKVVPLPEPEVIVPEVLMFPFASTEKRSELAALF